MLAGEHLLLSLLLDHSQHAPAHRGPQEMLWADVSLPLRPSGRCSRVERTGQGAASGR